MSIKTDAVVIRDETIAGANTATRVGSNLAAIADDLVAKQAEIDLNTAKITFDSTSSTRLANTSGTNTGDQDLSGYLLNTTDTLTGDLTVSNVLNVDRADNGYTSNIGTTINGSIFAEGRIYSLGDIDANGAMSASNLSGTNTGDQDISGIATNASDIATLQEGLLTDTSPTITTSRNSLATDADGMNNSTSATDVTITILSDADQVTADGSAFSVGALLSYKRSGTGNVILTAGSGVALTTMQTYALDDVITIRKTLTDTWEYINPPKHLGVPQNSKSTAYTLVLADSGKHILHPSADTTARTFTIPANSSVPFDIGTTVSFVNQNAGGDITIAITTDTMRLAGAGTTGSRTLTANGIATAIKVTATEWLINGTNLT